MKANEAPENVYLALNVFGDIIKDQWQFHRLCNNDIEYTRTDAFIEKACAWLNDNANKYWSTEFVDSGEMVEDFRKYMKGE